MSNDTEMRRILIEVKPRGNKIELCYEICRATKQTDDGEALERVLDVIICEDLSVELLQYYSTQLGKPKKMVIRTNF